MTRRPHHTPRDGNEERKRLGQFFTGEPLARLLAVLADASSAQSIIDPMAGSGDMLVAATQVGARPTQLTAIEIDSEAAFTCQSRISQDAVSSDVRVGDAFALETWALLGHQVWDLVITNPPYVRYQRTSQRSGGRIALPSSADVRKGLERLVERRDSWSDEDRRVFRTLVSGYGGLSDLAVPAWILCASLVSVGGRIAMVVPDTWLSRDYASPVLYLLRRFFDLECVVEDGDAAWFPDALVRTTLLVARRTPSRSSALHGDDGGYVHVRLSAGANTAGSIVGGLYPENSFPESAFSEMTRGVLRSGLRYSAPNVEARWVSCAHFDDQLRRLEGVSWFDACEQPGARKAGANRQKVAASSLPVRIREALREASPPLTSLEGYGWRVGQGLRTGANRFFYGESIDEFGSHTLFEPDPILGAEPILVPTELLRTVVRRQQDFRGLESSPSASPGRVLCLQTHVLPEDAAVVEQHLGHSPYGVIPEPLASLVRNAACADIDSNDPSKRLPEMSAVATNIRRPDQATPARPPRFWYQLPEFATRHVPELFIPRINHGGLSTMVNAGVVVDANFSSLWRNSSVAISPQAMFALLQSYWTVAVAESSATVLGGGALKVEATHLRWFPLPQINSVGLLELEHAGELLASARGAARQVILESIDEIIWAGVSPSACSTLSHSVRQLADHLLRLRNPRLAERREHAA